MCGATTNLVSGLGQLLSMRPPGVYAKWLRKATEALEDVEFGLWNDIAFPKDRFDRDFWVAGDPKDDEKYGYSLKVRTDKTAAEAVEAIIQSPDRWRLDCAHMVQVANLYALLKTLGPEKFNLRVGPRMILRPRESTGLLTKRHYGRTGRDTPWRVVLSFRAPRLLKKDEPTPEPFHFAPEAPLTTPLNVLLDDAPPGSRIRWTNLAANDDDQFRHENCIKLQKNIYVGHGFHDLITGNEFTRENLEILLAGKTTSSPSALYIKDNIYIDEIEAFETF